MPRCAAFLTECFFLCNLVQMSSKALSPFRKITVLPDGVFISPPGISPHSRLARSAFRIHRGKVISPFSRSFNFQGAVNSPSTKRQKLKKICIVYGEIFWFYFWFVAIDHSQLSILDCWKNIGKLTPLPSIFLDKFFGCNSVLLLEEHKQETYFFSKLPTNQAAENDLYWTEHFCIFKKQWKNPFRTIVRKGGVLCDFFKHEKPSRIHNFILSTMPQISLSGIQHLYM